MAETSAAHETTAACASRARAYYADVSSSGYTPARRSIDQRLLVAGASKLGGASTGEGTAGGRQTGQLTEGADPPRRPETPEERHERRQAWGAQWSAAMRDAWDNRQRG